MEYTETTPEEERPHASSEEKHAQNAPFDRGETFRFDRSFYAKLTLSDPKVKEYYAALASALLSYEKVRAAMRWGGVGFSAGRSRIAYIAFRGKTLCLFLALDPATQAEGRYKAQDVSDIKAREKTPAMFKVRSDGAARHAVAKIADTASLAGLLSRGEAVSAVSAKDFPPDTFGNLIARGLIRVLRHGGKERASLPPEEEGTPPRTLPPQGAYRDTVDTTDALFSRHAVYRDLTLAFSEGRGQAEFVRRHMLRAIDEIWVRAVEDAVGSLDRLVRNPNHYIAETEEVLPIEMTKKITGRSVAHLSRHTDYLSRNDDGDITPTKMLNIFRDDSLLTYENKFLNTLLNRLYLFVNRRYTIARDRGIDETEEALTFESEFESGRRRGRVRIEVTYSERPEEEAPRRVPAMGGLFSRVERLNDVVTGYIHSDFARKMEKNFIRPPVMRTNAILKNKYFRECLALWEFIERYDDAGYGIVVDETKKEVSATYIRDLYQGAVTQYFLFRHALEEGYGEEEAADTYTVRPAYTADEGDFFRAHTETFHEARESGDAGDDDIADALLVALLADGAEEQYGTDGFSRTFHARLRLAEDGLKENFARLSTALLAYDRVKMRESNLYASYTFGRHTLARVAVAGKTLRLYLALAPDTLPEKYRAENVSDIARYTDTPTLVRVRSRRSVTYALELFARLAEAAGLAPTKKTPVTVRAADYPALSVAEMIEKGWMTPIRRPRFDGGRIGRDPSLGTARSPVLKRLYDATERLSVREGLKDAEMIREGAYLPKSETTPGRTSAADTMRTLVRPTGEYDTPTAYGIDDSAGYMKDIREEEGKARVAADPLAYVDRGGERHGK